jgi:hypothetical protein
MVSSKDVLAGLMAVGLPVGVIGLIMAFVWHRSVGLTNAAAETPNAVSAAFERIGPVVLGVVSVVFLMAGIMSAIKFIEARNKHGEEEPLNKDS